MKLFFIIFFINLYFVQAEKYDNVMWLNRKLPNPERPNRSAAQPRWKRFTQKLDNFNEYNKRSWNMRYLMNDQFSKSYKPNGPIFIMLGGETEIHPGWLQSGQMYDMAKLTDAMLYYLEHRFYGKSKPSYSLSLSDLTFLNVRQTLADYANFITQIKQNITLSRKKVIVFGASYAGNLAVWMRMKYPELVYGAVVSSAPLKNTFDFKEYLEVVAKILNDPKCVEVIKNGTKAIQSHLITGYPGIQKIKEDFHLCQTFNPYDFYDEAFFYHTIAGEFSKLILHSAPRDISSACSELKHTPVGDDYTKLAKFIKKRRQECVENYNDFILSLSSYYSKGGNRQWLFQVCNELGYFQTSSSQHQPFYNYFPIDLNYQMCTDIFHLNTEAEHIEGNVLRLNDEYSVKNLVKVSRIIAVYGSNDPWTVLGLKKDLNKESPVIIVPGGTHCQDLFSISRNDSVDMKNAKLKVQNIIKSWAAKP